MSSEKNINGEKKLDTLAARVDYLINKRGFTSVSQAAKACAVPQPRLNDIVRGKTLNPRAETIQKIAYELDTTVEWLLEKSGPILTSGAKPYESRADDHPQIAQPPPDANSNSLTLQERSFLDYYRQLSEAGQREALISVVTIIDREKRKGEEGGHQAHKTAL